jgi:hypothetical protein
LAKKETILQYNGPIQYDTVSHLIRQLQDEFDERGLSITVYKKVLVVMIELLENIYKYCDEKCMEANFKLDAQPHILVEEEAGIFYIQAGNPLLKADGKKLRKYIDTINSFDKEGLLELYKHTITNGKFSEKGGAGLGLMEIARIAHDPIHYLFRPINAYHEYYSIRASVK